MLVYFGCIHLEEFVSLGPINNTMWQTVDASVLADTDKGKDSPLVTECCFVH